MGRVVISDRQNVAMESVRLGASVGTGIAGNSTHHVMGVHRRTGMAAEQMTLLGALRKYVFPEGTPNSTILQEFKQLSTADKDWFRSQFTKEFDIEIIVKTA